VREVLAVFIGGLVGTSLRLTIDTLFPHSDATFPASTLAINLIGSFALGLLVARVWPRASAVLKAGLGPGLLGSFTTFSAFAVSLVSLVDAEEWMLAAVYAAVTLVGGFAAAWAGLRLGRTS